MYFYLYELGSVKEFPHNLLIKSNNDDDVVISFGITMDMDAVDDMHFKHYDEPILKQLIDLDELGYETVKAEIDDMIKEDLDDVEIGMENGTYQVIVVVGACCPHYPLLQ
jgi:hypothetical protein